ncbi:class I SAM-dependent methyltransferase [Flammeovirga aprica]|uniref:Class I SAM-dependent methyltransferase n=1 Tax=Flammeovirga aprica JL-4 TaxID=694437 RepID=A0A7X9S142_9BACT|nr:class I SAM-dependent methyltransferase [Flammeovirga aprica]NME72483.1 class I SAM-dependent methyltransferase [Flammeovirga aprica JL-4]
MAALIHFLQKNKFLNSILQFNYIIKKGFLHQVGWSKSIKKLSSIDKEGESIPWFTYGTIHFLKQKNLSDLHLFEYGSGNSTFWFSKRVKSITSVEHDKEWYTFVNDKCPSNVDYRFKDVNNGYEDTITETSIQFDIVIIDGRKRVACAKKALPKLTDRGVIIWDNSNREKYNEGYQFLTDNGFKKIDFYGLAPSHGDPSMTTVFYKEGNCLGI